jgi:hypothetical protein
MKKWIVFLWIIFSSVSLMNLGAPSASEGKDDLEVTVKGVDLNPTGASSMVVLGKGGRFESHGGKFDGRPRRPE